MGANFGIAGMDWQQRVNWERLREYRIERARAMMQKHGLGAMLCMSDENVRYITGTLTPGWNRLKPGLRYAMLCGDGRPILFEQGDIGFQIERHSPWIPEENVRHSALAQGRWFRTASRSIDAVACCRSMRARSRSPINAPMGLVVRDEFSRGLRPRRASASSRPRRLAP